MHGLGILGFAKNCIELEDFLLLDLNLKRENHYLRKFRICFPYSVFQESC